MAAWKQAARNLEQRSGKGIVGINIGANKDSADRIGDYEKAFARLAPLADYVTVNVSSPNTPGLRGLQNRDELTGLLDRLVALRGAAQNSPICSRSRPIWTSKPRTTSPMWCAAPVSRG